MEQLRYRPAEAARMLGMGRTASWVLIRSCCLRSIKLGDARFITADALRAFVCIPPEYPRRGLVLGACKGKADRPDYPGYAGRRVLFSRKWSGKTLADYRGDRKRWLMDMLGLSATDDTGRYRWEQVISADSDYLSPPTWFARGVTVRMRWKHALDEARRRAQSSTVDLSVVRRAA